MLPIHANIFREEKKAPNLKEIIEQCRKNEEKCRESGKSSWECKQERLRCEGAGVYLP
jgi:hypothetical protein